MSDGRTIRRAGPDDIEACAGIVERLDAFFTPDVPEKVRADIPAHDCWVLAEAGHVVGFAVVAARFPAAAEILWAAVDGDRRGAGLGTRLIDHVLRELAGSGVRLVEVKTLDPSANYAPYRATYAFWRARGFLQVDMIDPLPEWPPGNPAAILIAALEPPAPRPPH